MDLCLNHQEGEEESSGEGGRATIEPGWRCPPPSSILQASRGGEGRLKNLTGGVRGEMEERWGRQEFLGARKGKGSNFINIKIVIGSISAFSRT